MTLTREELRAAELLDAVARCNSGTEAVAVIVAAMREEVQLVRREATDTAYAEGREDRDRLRRGREADQAALADLLGAIAQAEQRGTSAPRDVQDAVERARRYLDRERAS